MLSRACVYKQYRTILLYNNTYTHKTHYYNIIIINFVSVYVCMYILYIVECLHDMYPIASSDNRYFSVCTLFEYIFGCSLILMKTACLQ